MGILPTRPFSSLLGDCQDSLVHVSLEDLEGSLIHSLLEGAPFQKKEKTGVSPGNRCLVSGTYRGRHHPFRPVPIVGTLDNDARLLNL